MDPSPGTAVVVGAGCRNVVVGDGWRTIQCHLRGRPRDQTWTDSPEAHPHPSVHGSSHKPLSFLVHLACHASP